MSVILVRKYTKPDTTMLEQARLFHDLILPDLAAWTALFPWMDMAWMVAMLADIEAADAYPTDDSVVADIRVTTGDVASSMTQGRAALHELDMYATLAWPTDMSRQRVFGQDRWAENNRNTLKLKESLELANSKADQTDYKSTLLAKGYTQLKIDALLTLAQSIDTKNRMQENLKAGRTVNSHDRIALMNMVWGHIVTVHICAEVVHATDADRRNQYRLYPPAPAAEVTALTVKVTKAADGSPVAGASVTIDADGGEARTTNAEGVASFELTDAAELLEVKIEDPVLGTFTFADQAIVPGEENTLAFAL